MQDGHAGVAQRWCGQLVHDAVADDDAPPVGEITAAFHELRYGRSDGGPPRPWWEVVDRLVGGVDEPEPVGLQAT
jgi:hypothetical protein